MQPNPKEILDNLYDCVYVVDPERRITYWNKGAERISDYPASRVTGSFCYENLLNHVTENGIQLCHDGCPLQATISDGKPCKAEVNLHSVDGHRVPVQVRTSPIQNASGEIIGAVESFSDNTSLMTARRHVSKLEKNFCSIH